MNKKRKTSISLPAPPENLCDKHYATVMANLPFYLRYLRRHQPSRQKLRTHNDGSEGIIIVQVYWDMRTYNSLHSLAFALRWSVSYLNLRDTDACRGWYFTGGGGFGSRRPGTAIQ